MSVLDDFLPASRGWFERALGAPTPPQAQAWPAIRRGEHALILAPTGSGKTLAAFFAGIDAVFRELGAAGDPSKVRRRAATGALSAWRAGVRILYVSPLKALNNDVQRNLEAPLAGIRAEAERLGEPLPELRTAVRTGDTPATDRQRMLRQPPQILITTPESLYLMLTSPNTRDIFRTVHTVIVDEIHTLVGDKRGAHLALSLERLAQLTERPPQRIGLSATIKPLDEAARFLGGQAADGSARPVAVIDASYKKALELSVVTAVDSFDQIAGGSIWAHVVPRLLEDIESHRTTLIFANNRRLAERTADRLNLQWSAAGDGEADSEVLAPGGIPRDGGIAAIGAEGPFRAHHGSMSKEARREMERALKAGQLPALVGTSSLELGIDIGSIDLVAQLQSPKSVAQGLQRAGRAGHLVGQTSVAKIYATHREDVVEAAAVVRGMLDGDVEPVHAPENPLDVLSQHIVSMVAQEPWDADALYALARGAYAFRNLPRRAFDLVVAMLSGRYAVDDADAVRALRQLRPRLSFDAVNNRLNPLPGTRMAALSVAGTITDRGAFGVYLADGRTKLGELDEEFVYETKVGNVFLLGSQTWRVTAINDERVIVQDAAGAAPRMPFWRGDMPWRDAELGLRIGRFRREIAERIHEPGAYEWLRETYHCDDASARAILEHIAKQLDAGGRLGTDRAIVVEQFDDAVGARYLAVHSVFGGRVNGAWAIALAAALQEALGAPIATQVNDDGILLRLPEVERAPALDAIHMTPEQARERLLRDLASSPVFGAHFRMNAQRALLLPGAVGRKRTPFWLQRLKAKDLLSAVWRFDDFPIVAETFRDCLVDVFDLPHLERVLRGLQPGAAPDEALALISVRSKTPSPIAAGLLARFEMGAMYEWDEPKAERALRALTLRRDVLEELLGAQGGDLSALLGIPDVEALAEPGVQGARSLEALAVHLFDYGDLTLAELLAWDSARGLVWAEALVVAGRAVWIALPGGERLVHHEHSADYGAGIALSQSVLMRCFQRRDILTRTALIARYPFDPPWLDGELRRLVDARVLARGRFTQQAAEDEFALWTTLTRLHQRRISALRDETRPVGAQAFLHFLLERHGIGERRGVQDALTLLPGWPAALDAWQYAILPARTLAPPQAELTALLRAGAYSWVIDGRRIRLIPRGEGALYLVAPDDAALATLSADAQRVHAYLQAEGASLLDDVCAGTGLAQKRAIDALSALAQAGLATADAFAAISAALADRDEPHAAVPRGQQSALAADLAERLGARPSPPQAPGLRRPSVSAMRNARQRVRTRMSVDLPAPQWSEPWRWSLVHRAALLGPARSDEVRVIAVARGLLARYGIVTREICDFDGTAVAWADLYDQLQRLEMRGEIRRGYFVEGLSGVQFAEPDALERLRGAAQTVTHSDRVAVVSALDPVLVAIEADQALRLTRIASTQVALWRGRAVLTFMDGGARVTQEAGHDGPAPQAVIDAALRAWLGMQPPGRRIVVSSWNGESPLGTPAETTLARAGFGRDPNGMSVYR